ncbi:MAG: hypothetical protein EBR91_00100 [Flavobacteriia bacterium]|nr:hypothetical protein [Flavobacteriia bacterium]
MKIPRILKNKFTITGIIFMIYMLFLDDSDIFTIVSNLNKRKALVAQNVEMKQKLTETRSILKDLYKIDYLESYARTNKFFKKQDEEIFVIIPKNIP